MFNLIGKGELILLAIIAVFLRLLYELIKYLRKKSK